MESGKAGESEKVRIKKYGNRRLYDTRQSRYITLEDLAAIVQSGDTVEVVDPQGNDLTRQVLTQVILEQQDRLDMLPVELLHAIIRTQGTLQQAPFRAFLSGIAKQVTSAGSLWVQQMAAMFGSIPGFQAVPENGASPEKPRDAAGKAPADELQSLRSRLDALLDSLGKSRGD